MSEKITPEYVKSIVAMGLVDKFEKATVEERNRLITALVEQLDPVFVFGLFMAFDMTQKR